MNTRQQGDIGELSAALWFASRGATVACPVGHSPDWDLVVEWGGGLQRVQAKTSTQYRRGRWIVAICTRGGNRSWSGRSKAFTADRCDFLFVHVGDGRRWLIPSRAVQGSNAIALGGDKYADYEIETGVPLRRPARLEIAA